MGQRAGHFSFRIYSFLIRHLASPSLGHYAPLSFVVKSLKALKSFISRLKAAPTFLFSGQRTEGGGYEARNAGKARKVL